MIHLPLTVPGQRIGLFGGSFNPPHEGHLHVAETALKALELDRIWWLVSPQNPLKSTQQMARYEERLEAVRRQVRHPHMAVVELERVLGTRYTAELIRSAQHHYPKIHFIWIMGADNLAGFHRWKAWRALAERVPIAVIDRAPHLYRAVCGPAALALAPYRMRGRKARLLADQAPPAWGIIMAPRHPASSTALRKE